jgi:hypothetical protein
MVPQVIVNIGWAIVFMAVGATVGASFIITITGFLPKILSKFTPNLDEEKEIVRGNIAVAEYFGRIVSSAVIGVSIIVAAAILGGILAALHG